MTGQDADEALARLRRQWLRRLSEEWFGLNYDHLGRRLRHPQLRLLDAERRLGSWDPTTRTLGISEQHIWQRPWHEVVQTLAHEMAHQAADELFDARDEPPHGPAFRRACEALAIDPAASASQPVDPAGDRILQRVQKLLSLATSDNPHESAAAMARANSLLLQYNLELPTRAPGAGYGFRVVGEMRARLSLHWKQIARILGEFFFVRCLWINTYDARSDRAGRSLEIAGTESNLEIASYVHGFLHAECERLWQVQRRERGLSGRSAKREFLYGLLTALADKLRAERTQDGERGLVWVGDPGLQAWFQRRHPRTTGFSGSGVYRTGAYEAGQRAGQEMTIHKPVRHGPTDADPKLLR